MMRTGSSAEKSSRSIVHDWRARININATRCNFERLLDACEALAAAEGMQVLIAGANIGCYEAYRALRARGFRTDIQGVAMQRSNDPGYHTPGVYIIDDWR